MYPVITGYGSSYVSIKPTLYWLTGLRLRVMQEQVVFWPRGPSERS